jgi:tetratricopeptide (TPR) repeat protein
MPCSLGLAYGLAGRTAESEAAFARALPGHSQCLAFHGTALAHEGDVAGARRVWAAALKIGPDLPPVYQARGQFELDHGDVVAAATDFATAHAKAPHFADPLKGWGDVLAKQGRWNDAAAKYAEALNYAPDWAELQAASRTAAARR